MDELAWPTIAARICLESHHGHAPRRPGPGAPPVRATRKRVLNRVEFRVFLNEVGTRSRDPPKKSSEVQGGHRVARTQTGRRPTAALVVGGGRTGPARPG